MTNKKTSIISRPKVSLGTKAWTYVSIAGALVAIIYAGLSLRDTDSPPQTPQSQLEERMAPAADAMDTVPQYQPPKEDQ